jgi:hypothetical protein
MENIHKVLTKLFHPPKPNHDKISDMEKLGKWSGQRKSYEEIHRIKLSEQQNSAIGKVIKYPLVIITGEGGTGKSTLIDIICKIYDRKKIALLSAYGTVASRLGKSHDNAMTINMANRLYNYNMNAECVNKKPLICNTKEEIIIIDEMSVLNIFHLNMIFNTYHNIRKLILLGDPNQMTSIDRGEIIQSFFQKYQSSNLIVKLDTVYRIADCKGLYTMKKAFRCILEGNGKNVPFYKRGNIVNHPVILLPRHGNDITKSFKPIIENFKTPHEWNQIQIITQRNKERITICETLLVFCPSTRIYFSNNGNERGKKKNYDDNDLYVNERIIFKKRVRDFNRIGSDVFNESNNNQKKKRSRIYIYPNSLKTITKIEDIRSSSIIELKNDIPSNMTHLNYDKMSKHLTRKAVTNTKSKFNFGRDNIRVVSFDDNTAFAINNRRDISKMARGNCVTIASMQGGQHDTIVIYIREGVSYTFDRHELYTSVSRARKRIIIIGTIEEVDKISKRLPRKRNNCLFNYLPDIPMTLY